MRVGRVALAFLTAAALVLTACGGDDDDSSGGDDEPDGMVADSEYVEALASAFAARTEQPAIANTQEEADCTANRIVEEVGQARLVEAGLSAEVLERGTLGSSGFPDLSADDASAIVDAIFECIDVGGALGAQLVAGGADPEQADCLEAGLESSDGFHAFYEAILRTGNTTQMERSTAEDVVDTLFECIGQGEFFRSSVAGSITITDEQVECLDTALASSSDYRDALVASFTGEQPSSDPPFREEVEECVSAEQLTPTTTAAPPTTG